MFCFLGSVILLKLTTTVSSYQYNFGLIRNITLIIYHMKAEVTFLLHNIITRELIWVT